MWICVCVFVYVCVYSRSLDIIDTQEIVLVKTALSFPGISFESFSFLQYPI